MEDQTNIPSSEEPNLPSEQPEQDLDKYPRWEYPERRDPKWGEVTKKGLIIGRGARQKIVPPDEVYKLATMDKSQSTTKTAFKTSTVKSGL